MESIKDLLKNRQIKKVCKFKWQDQALEAIKKLTDGNQYKGQIFKCFKLNSRKAEIALNDCVELEKRYSRYFFKVYSLLK